MPDLHDDIDELVAAVRDGEEGDGERLAELLRESPGARDRYLRHAYLGALLRESFGAVDESPKAMRRPQSRWIAPLAVAATLIIGFFFAMRSTVDSALVATLENADGVVVVDGSPIAPGGHISPGQRFTVSGNHGGAAFVYPDGTRVLVVGEAGVTLAESDRKMLVVERGVLHADVAKQPAGRPMEIVTPDARLEILGTRFVVGAEEGATDLNVTEGKVRMTRTVSGESVEVAAGHCGRFVGLRDLAVSELPEVADTWRLDFEDGERVWRYGEPSTVGLPSGSSFGVRASEYTLPFNGNRYHHIEFSDSVDGLFGVGKDSHFHLSFRAPGEPSWFNVFIFAVYPDEQGRTQFRQYKLRPGSANRYREVEKQWHRLSVPMDWFGGKISLGEYGDEPPPPGAIVTRVRIGSPAPDREIQIDDIGATPDGPGRKVITTVDP